MCLYSIRALCCVSAEAAQTPGTLAAVCPSSGGMSGGEEIVVLGHKLGPPCEWLGCWVMVNLDLACWPRVFSQT